MNIQATGSLSISGQAIVDEEHPWPGLASFREQDAHFFKGRSSDIEKLFSLVNRERLTLLLGISGLGKSSLLQAGLFPRLRQNQILPIAIRLDFGDTSISLHKQVVAAIDRQVHEKAIEAPTHHDSETLWEYFHRKDTEFWDARNRMFIPLLCFDQFEEIFTLGRENHKRAAERNKFITELADLVEGRCPENVKARLEANPDQAKNFSFSRHPYKLIFSLREDYLADLEGLRTLIPSVIHNRFRLLRMNGEQALAVVNQTHGRLIAPSVAETIVRLVGGNQGEELRELLALRIEPALLSLICRELNERRIADKANRIDAQSVVSNREQILEDFYERSLDGHSPELRWFIEDRLITTVSGVRNSEAYDNALGTSGITVEALDQLIQCRLLRLEERDGNKRIELIHDVLTKVVRKSRDQRLLLEKKKQVEQERYEAQQKEQAAKAELQRSKRRALIFAILTIACFLTTVWSVVSWQKANKASREAQNASEDAQHALAVAEYREAQRHYENNNIQYALAHLARSVRLDHDWSSSRTLMINLLQQNSWLLPMAIFKHENGVKSANFSTDGSRMVTVSRGNTAQLWDVQTGKVLGETMTHEGAVYSAIFSVDGSRLVTASSDKTARLWNAHTGKAVGEPITHEDSVRSAAFSADGSRVVTASGDKTARLWDAYTGKELGEAMTHASTVYSAVFSADGSRVVTASRDKTARLWDAYTGEALGEVMAHEGPVYSATFSADDSRVVTASSDKTARLWDARTGKALGEAMTHADEVRSAAFSTDGSRVVTASWDKTARLWDAHTGKGLGEAMKHTDKVRSVVFSADDSRVITASSDKTARLWNAYTGGALGEAMTHDGAVYSAAFNADGSRVVTASRDKTARLWDARTRKALSKAMMHEGTVYSAAFSTDGSRVVTASDDRTARLWDARTGKPLGKEAMTHNNTVYFTAFSTDGSRVVTASGDETARLWDAHTGKMKGKAMSHKGTVYSATFSPDGSRVLTASGDRTARLWNAYTGVALGEGMTHDSTVYSAAFNADGSRVVTASWDKTARLWNAHTGKAFGKPMTHDDLVMSAAFSADGSRVVTASWDKTARLWDAHTGKMFGEPMTHDDEVMSAAFSTDGSRVVTASWDKTARLWDAHTGKALGEVMLHAAEVKSAAFSPDGSHVVTASWDKTARLWDAHTGKALGEAMMHDDEVYSAAFSTDGSRVLTASGDNTARLWDVSPVISDDNDLIATLAEALIGIKLREYGAIETLNDQMEHLENLRHQTATAPLGEPTAESFTRWFLSDPWTRTISPLSKQTVPEYIQRQIAAGRREQMVQEFPDHPLLRPAAAPVQQ
jgi:WD40 repeat protein